jgi:hypothetical protein
MATTQFAFGDERALTEAMKGKVIEVQSITASESKTPSGSAGATTAAAPLGGLGLCRVSTDTLVYVSFGAAPNAGTDAIRFMLPAGATEVFAVNPGDKASVITQA